jgi:hypothetical protein
MRASITSIIVCFFFSFAAQVIAKDSSKPNILIIYADDLGYGDLAIQNPDSKIPTPHLDKLAKSSMRFSDGHSSRIIHDSKMQAKYNVVNCSKNVIFNAVFIAPKRCELFRANRERKHAKCRVKKCYQNSVVNNPGLSHL